MILHIPAWDITLLLIVFTFGVVAGLWLASVLSPPFTARRRRR